jgi:murein DD-endopeptidase MepM/ murein hydrolase activator NlpD
MKRFTITLLFLVVVGLGVFAYYTVLEPVRPTAEWLNGREKVGGGAGLNLYIADEGRGLKSVEVIFRRGEETMVTLYSEDFSNEGSPVMDRAFSVPLDIKKLYIEDGEGVIVLTVTDRSYWNLGRGNSVKLEYPVVVDTVAPKIGLLSANHVVVLGGSEVAVFSASPDTVRAGVRVGDYFFPGQTGAFEDDDTYAAFFSYPYDLPPGVPLFIEAEDGAGNHYKRNLPALVKMRHYRKRKITITDDFIIRKVPEVMSSSGIEETGDLLMDFLVVNGELRERGAETIEGVTKYSAPGRMWEGGFGEFRNAAVQSKYADLRTYYYEGQVVDEQYHLGFDLAATKQYPVPASNSGEVVFAGNLGIYGNTIVIDHGLGVSTLYAHLSGMDVDKGARVEKGEEIGRTGDTGLAGGDHLHFSVLVHGVPVTPLEWWDEKWVKNRILRRLSESRLIP